MNVVTRLGTSYVCAIHDGESMQDALSRFDRDRLWVERELGDVPVRSEADTATAWGIVWGRPGVRPVP